MEGGGGALCSVLSILFGSSDGAKLQLLMPSMVLLFTIMYGAVQSGLQDCTSTHTHTHPLKLDPQTPLFTWNLLPQHC